eukprot:458534-Amphidinium_carterae.1
MCIVRKDEGSPKVPRAQRSPRALSSTETWRASPQYAKRVCNANRLSDRPPATRASFGAPKWAAGQRGR